MLDVLALHTASYSLDVYAMSLLFQTLHGETVFVQRTVYILVEKLSRKTIALKINFVKPQI